MTHSITVHRGINKDLRPISVDGKDWGFAKLSHENFWTVHTNKDRDFVATIANGVRRIESEVHAFLKREGV